MATSISHEVLEELSNEELYILEIKIAAILRERRLRAVLKHRKDTNNPRVQSIFSLLEKEIRKTFTCASRVDEYIDMLESFLQVDLDAEC